jgi:glucose 1-dehydrogenase
VTVRAVTVRPGHAASGALEDIPEPPADEGAVLVRGLAWGVCGTDREIVAGEYGVPPPGSDRLVLGHESLGDVLEVPHGTGLSTGDRVVGIVRRPDPVPCVACAVGQWDMCRNGRYTEHGIKGRHGFARERWRAEPGALVPVDPALGLAGALLEPTSVVAKAWDQIERIGARAPGRPRRVLVTGAGPIGLLAALLGVQRGLEVHVLDIVTEGPKPQLVADLGATYHTGPPAEACPGADVVLECSGVASVVFDVMGTTAPVGIVCLTGVSSGGRDLSVDIGALNRSMVLENDVVFGSVNANRRHYEAAAAALAAADRSWLHRLITRTVPLDDWTSAFEPHHDDIKVVVTLTGTPP